MNSIFIRRSVRQYLDRPVEKEKVEQLLRAAMQAPSAGNQRPWEFIVVENSGLLEELALVSPYAGPVKAAKTAIVVLGNLNLNTVKFPEYLPQDLAAATQNLLLQAVELGLGGVWLGVAPVADRMAHIQKIFHLPEAVVPFAVIALGYPATEHKFVDRYEQDRVHYDKY